MQLHWDIFCRVIDNYGDIGVCWRLARQLADEHGKKVRLWVDDLHPLKQLCPEINTDCERQFWQKIEIIHWTEKLAVDRVADVVIEAFACDMPVARAAILMASMIVISCIRCCGRDGIKGVC